MAADDATSLFTNPATSPATSPAASPAADLPPGPPAGVAALHPRPRSLPVLVAPTLTTEHNTLALPALPLACWRLEAARFDFDSSVVRPDAEAEFAMLAAMFDTTGGAALSVFGHADPVGDDEYNKALSGRRARAIYALVTRDPAIWNELAGAEAWPAAAFTMMQDRTGKPPGTARDELFRAYMDAICHRPDGTAFSVEKAGFLGRGTDAGGKADVQGCSEFNPILRLSQDDEQALQAPDRRAERNERNAPNRRVLVFLFPPGMFVPPAAWPCPRTSEGSSGCRAQFWPDGDHRRAAQDREREYAHDKDTFACAFYDRMARRSPCEAVRKSLEMRLFSAAHEAIPGARYRVTAGQHDVREGTADAQGNLKEDNLVAPSRVLVEWDFPAAGGEAGAARDFAFCLSVAIDAGHTGDDAAITRRLNNLGYVMAALGDNVHAFQVDYGVAPSDGTLDAATRTRIIQIHDDKLARSEAGQGGA
jgi:hypothetical protein